MLECIPCYKDIMFGAEDPEDVGACEADEGEGHAEDEAEEAVQENGETEEEMDEDVVVDEEDVAADVNEGAHDDVQLAIVEKPPSMPSPDPLSFDPEETEAWVRECMAAADAARCEGSVAAAADAEEVAASSDGLLQLPPCPIEILETPAKVECPAKEAGAAIRERLKALKDKMQQKQMAPHALETQVVPGPDMDAEVAKLRALPSEAAHSSRFVISEKGGYRVGEGTGRKREREGEIIESACSCKHVLLQMICIRCIHA